MKVSAVVWEHCGNRFIMRGFWWTDEDRPYGWMIDAMMFGISMGINREPTLVEFDLSEDGDIQVPFVRSTMSSDRLMHGRGTVYMISGPLFDEVSMADSSNI